MKKTVHKAGSTPLFLFSIVMGSLFPVIGHAQLSGPQPVLVIPANASVRVTGGTVVLRNANVRCNGQWQASGGVTSFTGSGASTLGGTGGIQFYRVNVAKDRPSAISLSTNLQINKALNFMKGVIDLNGRQLLLTDTAEFDNETDSSRIIGPNGGKIVIAASSVNAPQQLNLGGLGAVLTSPDNLGSLTIDRSQMPVLAGNSGIERTYFIQPQHNTGLKVTLRFYYLRTELNGNDPSILNLWKSDDGIGWSFVGADARDTANKYVEKANIADLSYWTLAAPASPLPVRLVSFSAICTGNTVSVTWTTGSEDQADKFLLQRSMDGTSWATIGAVPAENAANGASYSFQDPSPQTSAYYRLQMMDRDGQSTYSNVFRGGCSDIGLPFMVYPNPASSQAVAQIALRQGCTGKLQLLNMSGQLLSETSWDLQTGINTLPIIVSTLASGTYVLRLLLPNGVQTTQLIKK